MSRLFTFGAIVLLAVTAHGQIVTDGTLDAAYGAALSVQSTDTQFGDAQNGDTQYAFSGSELDGVYATVENGRLHVMLTGNLESNFNKMEVFIDSVGGGVNTIDGPNLPAAVDAFCCGGFGTLDGALQRMDGLTFDTGFDADYYLTFTNGDEGVGPGSSTGNAETTFWALSAHYADLTQGIAGSVGALGMQINALGAEPGLGQGEVIDQNNNGWNGPDDPAGTPAEHEFVEPVSPDDATNDRNHRDLTNTIDLEMAINNSNVLGVVGAQGEPWDTIDDPGAVMTGLEFSVPLSAIGNPTGDVRITAFINGGGHDYASNQFSGAGVLSGNLGGDGMGGGTGDLSGVDLSMIDGDQFVTVSNSSTVLGDFNGDGNWDCADIDNLVADVAAGANTVALDMDGDGDTDADDVAAWLAVAGPQNGFSSGFFPGDANLDGFVDVSDLNIWSANKFSSNAAWCLGDFNADGFVDVSDLNIWNGTKFSSSDSVAAVPEPAGMGLLMLAICGLLGFRRK